MAQLSAMQRKSFTDVKLIKLCSAKAAKETCYKKKSLRLLVFWREQLLKELRTMGTTSTVSWNTRQTILSGFLWLLMHWHFSETAQLFFIQGVHAEFEVTKELSCLHRIITGENIFQNIEKTLLHYNQKWNLLRCVTNNGKIHVAHNKAYSFDKISLTEIVKM